MYASETSAVSIEIKTKALEPGHVEDMSGYPQPGKSNLWMPKRVRKKKCKLFYSQADAKGLSAESMTPLALQGLAQAKARKL